MAEVEQKPLLQTEELSMAKQLEQEAVRRLSLADLEQGTLEQILARLPLRRLPPCLLVCKQWLSIITHSPTFARFHARFHRKRTWFLLYTFPLKNSMLVYDTVARKSAFLRCLHSAADASRSKTGPLMWEGEKLLATADGLVFSVSRDGESFTVTNVVTRKNKLLPPPCPLFCHFAFVGMAYLWPTMSYQILLCGQAKPLGSGKGKPGASLVTTLYNSLTGTWTNAASTLSSESFNPCYDSTEPGCVDQFGRTRHCIWFEERFYCVLDRTLHVFDPASMTWAKLRSHDPHGDKKQVCLPPNLTHFFCLWECDGEFLVAGNVRNKESKNVTALWRLVPPLREMGTAHCTNGNAVFAWEQLEHVVTDECNDPALFTPFLFDSKWRYARGDTLCLIRDEPTKDQFEFCIYDLTKKRCKVVASAPRFAILISHRELENFSIQPCPFTYP